jgi:tetratricopeptide (TPR) repeat protein
MPTISQLEEMLGREPDDVFLTYSVAMLLAKEGRADEALARFDRVLELDADYVPAYFQKGMFQAGQGVVDEAKETLTRGIERATATGDAHARGEMEEFLATL